MRQELHVEIGVMKDQEVIADELDELIQSLR